MMDPPSVFSPGIDHTMQVIDPSTGPNPTYTKIRIGGETKFRLPTGRTHVEVWLSANLTEDAERAAMLAELVNSGDKTKAPWRAAIDKAARYLLKYEPPVWHGRVTRWDGTPGGNWTLRHVQIMAPVDDWSIVLIFELYVSEDVDYSIEVRHNGPNPVNLDARMIHAVHLPV